MCDGYAEGYTETRPTARKDHKCHECGTVIPKGVKYLYATYVFDGQGHTYKCCDRCKAVRKHMEAHVEALNKGVQHDWQKVEMCISIGGIQDELADGHWFGRDVDYDKLETRADWIELYEKTYMQKVAV